MRHINIYVDPSRDCPIASAPIVTSRYGSHHRDLPDGTMSSLGLLHIRGTLRTRFLRSLQLEAYRCNHGEVGADMIKHEHYLRLGTVSDK
jgi:hypothetical protein